MKHLMLLADGGAVYRPLIRPWMVAASLVAIMVVAFIAIASARLHGSVGNDDKNHG